MCYDHILELDYMTTKEKVWREESLLKNSIFQNTVMGQRERMK